MLCARAVFGVFKFQSLINKTETKQDEKENGKSECESERGMSLPLSLPSLQAAECGNACEMPYLNKQTEEEEEKKKRIETQMFNEIFIEIGAINIVGAHSRHSKT